MRLFLETEYGADCPVLVEDLEIFVNQDDALLNKLVNELLSALLFVKLLLQFLKVLLENVVVFFMEVENE